MAAISPAARSASRSNTCSAARRPPKRRRSSSSLPALIEGAPMAAPVLAPLLAFLLSAGGAAFPWGAAAVKDEAALAGIYADLPAICAASDPLIDAIGDRYPNSRTLARLTRVADAVCAAAQKPDNPLDQAAL